MSVNALVGVFLAVIVFGVIIWAVQKILAVLPVAEPWKTVAYVVIVLIGVIFAVQIIAQLLGAPMPWGFHR